MVDIICEIASAHNGDADELRKLLAAADLSGADWVKVQIYRFENLIAGDNATFSDLKKIEIPLFDWTKILDSLTSIKTRVIVEPFDDESFDHIKDHAAVAAFKIPTADLADLSFVESVLSQAKPVFIAVGGAKLEELDSVFEIYQRYKDTEVILLHGFQNFPTRLEDSLLSKIRSYQQRYQCRVGFADHVDAEDEEVARTLPSMAMAAGASVIEKHLTLDRSKKGPDYYSALNPDEFTLFVEHIRTMTAALGESDLAELNDAELEYRNKMKKFAVVNSDFTSGDLLESAAIEYRRTSEPGLTRQQIDELSSRKLVVNLPSGSLILENMFGS